MNLSDQNLPPPARALPTWLAVAIAAALGLLVTCYRIGAADVCGYNEAVEGLFVQQMVEHDEVLFPRGFSDQPMYKPPLFHWTALMVDRLAGVRKVTAASLRFPSALYATAGIILVVVFTASWLSSGTAGLLAGMLLLGAYQYVSQGRYGRVDMTLTFCEALTLLGFAWWWRRTQAPPPHAPSRETALRYLFAAGLGLGVLAKGPVGALLPLLAIAIFIVVHRRWEVPRRLFSAGSVLLALAIACSWYLACLATRQMDFLHRQIGSENFGRFFGSLGSMAPWYYVQPLLLNSVPMSLIAPLAVGWALRRGREHAPQARDEAARDEIAGLFAIFWLTTVLFFTLAAYKRRAYLLPLWPPTAALIAWWLTTCLPVAARRWAVGSTIAICALLASFNLIYLPRREIRTCGNDSFRPVALHVNRIVGAEEPLYIYGMDDPAALMFYLDRPATRLRGELGDAPPGYVLLPAPVWSRVRNHAPDLQPILGPVPGSPPLVLLRHGKIYAAPTPAKAARG